MDASCQLWSNYKIHNSEINYWIEFSRFAHLQDCEELSFFFWKIRFSLDKGNNSAQFWHSLNLPFCRSCAAMGKKCDMKYCNSVLFIQSFISGSIHARWNSHTLLKQELLRASALLTLNLTINESRNANCSDNY